MEDIKMLLKTLRKEASKHFYKVKVSGHAARLTSSSLSTVTVWAKVTNSSVLIATTCEKQKCQVTIWN